MTTHAPLLRRRPGSLTPRRLFAFVLLFALGSAAESPAPTISSPVVHADEPASPPPSRSVPRPLPDHPGNVYLEGESVFARWPDSPPGDLSGWRLVDDRGRLVCGAALTPEAAAARAPIGLGGLDLGWYRLEFDSGARSNVVWTTAAVLRRLAAPVPGDSPVCVDSATSWFAPQDVPQQRRLASLAALAGVNWVRDRLRWRELQPKAGPLTPEPTTSDTAAEVQTAAGLKVLQVFHDTPSWARESPEGGGRFAPDLREVYRLGRALATRFKGRVAAWEPWNEANVATFGGHTVDQMCSWQKAAWLGFKAGDPDVLVGWNATAAVPTVAHTEGVLANETWPYYDTYNIHSYDWSHAYAVLWQPARAASAGRPLWITEADRGTPHRQQGPWFDQDPELERRKAEWLAQSYASSLFAGARRHFHFILGAYHEPNGVQFGLLRLDLTPRPAYAALAAVGRCLAGARARGRWRPGGDVNVYAFHAKPDGEAHDVLVAWAEKEVDWPERGHTTAPWNLPVRLDTQQVIDHLGRSQGRVLPTTLSSAPVFVFLPAGQAARLPLEPPPPPTPPRSGESCPVVLQLTLPPSQRVRVEDLPWSEGYAYGIRAGQTLDLPIHVYNFGNTPVNGHLGLERQPAGWEFNLATNRVTIASQDRIALQAGLRVPPGSVARDGWVVLRAECGAAGRPALAFRFRVRD